MPIRQPTLRVGTQLRVAVGTAADQATRDLTAAWARAWDTLSKAMTDAILDVLALAGRLGRWPPPWELRHIARLQRALLEAQEALTQLGQRTGVTVVDSAGQAIHATVDAEPRLIASQLPAAQRVDAAASFAARILPQAIDAIVARTTGQIHATTWPLSVEAVDAMRRELALGVATGAHPNTTARAMLGRVEGAFNGGLTRAINIARTETLDAYRVTSQYTHSANSDVLSGWQWMCTLSSRTCPACLAKNGTVYPVVQPGPLGHQQCRCARMPKVRTWRDLGINLDEPADTFPDARAWFAEQPEATQLHIMGAGRLELLRSGAVGWDDLATRRQPAGWRPNYVPTPVRDLQRAARSAA